MAEPAERQRTVLRIPRVEFDLSALAAGAIGWLAYQGSWPLLASILGASDGRALRDQFLSGTIGWTGLPFASAAVGAVTDARMNFAGIDLPAWKYAAIAVWMLVLWSVVAGAIARIYAVRIARDESIRVSDAFAFSLGNLKQFVLAPVFVAAAALFFSGLAALAGAVSAVPVAGPFAQVIAHPLALVAGLTVIVIAAGGFFGLPMMQAALATERNGTLDAISRTFSYVFTRPVAYVLSAGIVALVCRLINAFGGAFLDMTTRAMRFGAGWNTDPASPIDADRAIGWGALAGRDETALFSWPQPQHAGGLPVVGFYVAWLMTALAAVALHGFLLSYFVGGLTDIYFMLRRDVDGIDEGEVYVEGVELSLGAPVAGEPAGGKQS
jgi:hypothetical protein